VLRKRLLSSWYSLEEEMKHLLLLKLIKKWTSIPRLLLRLMIKILMSISRLLNIMKVNLNGAMLLDIMRNLLSIRRLLNCSSQREKHASLR
jgi:hypothetical protein